MGRPPCCDTGVGVKKGPWTPEEDIILVSYIQEHGPGNWRSVPENTGLMRCSKSCRLRWTNYLRPGIKRGNFTPHEEGIIVHLQALLGNKWAAIASYLPQRTDNDIKNYWNTHLKKKMKKQQTQVGTMQTTFNTVISPTYYSSLQPRLQEMQATSYSNATSSFCQSPSNHASNNNDISKVLQSWMRSPATKGTLEVQETVITHNDIVNDKKSSETSETSLLHSEADGSTFSLLEKWLLDEASGQGDELMEISAGCCADPIMF